MPRIIPVLVAAGLWHFLSSLVNEGVGNVQAISKYCTFRYWGNVLPYRSSAVTIFVIPRCVCVFWYFWIHLQFIVICCLLVSRCLGLNSLWFFLFFSYTIVLIYYAFCLVLMMLLRPLLVKKIACGLGKSDRFKSIYAALYFFPILTVLQAVGGGLLCEYWWAVGLGYIRLLPVFQSGSLTLSGVFLCLWLLELQCLIV